MDDIFTFHPGRTQSFQAKDILAVGIEKLGQTSKIKDFLARTSEASPDSEPTDEDEGGVSDFGMDEIDDEALDDFEGPNDLLQ